MGQHPDHPGQAIGYIRVSTDDQSLSVQAQHTQIQTWCQTHRLTLIAVYEDVGVSGGAPLDKRLGLMTALDALHPGMTLVAVKRDRIARDTMYAGMIERLAERQHACIRTCDGVGDGDTPEHILLRKMMDAFAEYERQIIKARTKTALQHKKRQGERISGRAPYGYRFTEHDTVVPDAAEQAVMAAARQYAAGGLSLRQIAARLAADGHLSRVGKPFTASTVRTMLRTVV